MNTKTMRQNGQHLRYNLQGGEVAAGYDELGTPGLSAFSGYIMQAYNAKLYWPTCEPLYSRIWRSDAETTIVRTVFNALTGQQMLTWELPQQIGGRELGEPNEADERQLDFAHSLTEDIQGGFHRWLAECNGRTSFYGFGVWEMPLGLRRDGWTPTDSEWTSRFNDNLVGLRDIAFRDYSSFYKWNIDDYTGRLDGFVQYDAPNPVVTIPIENLLHITYGDSTNPEGLATMEALWRLERVLYRYQFIHGIGSEHAAGHLKFTVKEELNAEAKAIIKEAARAVLSAQEGNYLTEIEGKFTADVMDTSFQAAPAIMEAMRYYSLLKLGLYGMQFAGMNTLSDTGSYSALQDSSSMALLLFNAMSEGFVKQANDQIGRRIFDNPTNKAAFAGATRRPVLKVSRIEKIYGLDELGRFAQAISAVFPLGDDDAIAIRRKSGVLPESLPVLDDNAEMTQPLKKKLVELQSGTPEEYAAALADSTSREVRAIYDEWLADVDTAVHDEDNNLEDELVALLLLLISPVRQHLELRIFEMAEFLNVVTEVLQAMQGQVNETMTIFENVTIPNIRQKIQAYLIEEEAAEQMGEEMEKSFIEALAGLGAIVALAGGALWSAFQRGKQAAASPELLARWAGPDDSHTCPPCSEQMQLGIRPSRTVPIPGPDVCRGLTNCRHDVEYLDPVTLEIVKVM